MTQKTWKIFLTAIISKSVFSGYESLTDFAVNLIVYYFALVKSTNNDYFCIRTFFFFFFLITMTYKGLTMKGVIFSLFFTKLRKDLIL